MYYIVLDFEWNQNTSRDRSKTSIPFEIIEIGAVKLDENRQMIDSYSQLICPKLYPELHYKTRELTGISQKEVMQGIDFEDAVMDFLEWCGDDYMFCTWGNMDLTELQRNMVHYKMIDFLPGPIKYLNIQKIFRLFYNKDNVTTSLENAAAYFNIEDSGGFHRAVCDAQYTAKIFALMDLSVVLKNYTVDYYQYPLWKKDELHLTYDHYYKYISRGYNTKEEALENREVKATRCFICGNTAPKKIRWFSSKTKNYYCLAYCSEHGFLRGKIKMKRMDDGKVVAIKTLRPADEETIQEIQRIKKEVIAKRRERRHKGCE